MEPLEFEAPEMIHSKLKFVGAVLLCLFPLRVGFAQQSSIIGTGTPANAAFVPNAITSGYRSAQLSPAMMLPNQTSSIAGSANISPSQGAVVGSPIVSSPMFSGGAVPGTAPSAMPGGVQVQAPFMSGNISMAPSQGAVVGSPTVGSAMFSGGTVPGFRPMQQPVVSQPNSAIFPAGASDLSGGSIGGTGQILSGRPGVVSGLNAGVASPGSRFVVPGVVPGQTNSQPNQATTLVPAPASPFLSIPGLQGVTVDRNGSTLTLRGQATTPELRSQAGVFATFEPTAGVIVNEISVVPSGTIRP